MKRRKRIGCDADGVAINFIDPARRVFAQMFGYPMPDFYEWDFASVIPEGRSLDYWRALGDARLHGVMDPYPGAVVALKALETVADVYIVTSPLATDNHWMTDRLHFFATQFGIPSHRVQFQHDKHTFAGDMLIDDKPENVAAWAEEHEAGIPVCWAHSYNERHDFGSLGYRIVRTNDWATVLRLAGG